MTAICRSCGSPMTPYRPASGGLVLVCLHCGRRWDAVARVELPPIPIRRASAGGRC